MDREKDQLIEKDNDTFSCCKYKFSKSSIAAFIVIALIVFVPFIIVFTIIFYPSSDKVKINGVDIHNNYGPVFVIHNNCTEDLLLKFSKSLNQSEDLIKINSNITFNLTRLDYGTAYALSLDSDLEKPVFTQFVYDFRPYFGQFSISVQYGFNIPLTLKVLEYPVTGTYQELLSGNNYPSWNHNINETLCPEPLRVFFDDQYVACNSPCNVFYNDYYCCWNKYQCYSKTCIPNENTCIESWCDGYNWNISDVFKNACNGCALVGCGGNINYMSNWKFSYVDKCKCVLFTTYQLTLCGY